GAGGERGGGGGGRGRREGGAGPALQPGELRERAGVRLDRLPAEPVEQEQDHRVRTFDAGGQVRRRAAAHERRHQARDRLPAVVRAYRVHGPLRRRRKLRLCGGGRQSPRPRAWPPFSPESRRDQGPRPCSPTRDHGGVKVSTRGDYAARALLSLALHGKDRPTSVKEIAERTSLPQPYLEQILLAVKGAGLVRSKRGVGGGYVLARAPEDITLAKILTAVDGPLTTLMGEHDHCEGHCILQEGWVCVSEEMRQLLEGFTLAQLVERTRIGHSAAAAKSSA